MDQIISFYEENFGISFQLLANNFLQGMLVKSGESKSRYDFRGLYCYEGEIITLAFAITWNNRLDKKKSFTSFSGTIETADLTRILKLNWLRVQNNKSTEYYTPDEPLILTSDFKHPVSNTVFPYPYEEDVTTSN